MTYFLRIVAACLALVAPSGHAVIVAQAKPITGGLISLHNERRVCVGFALYAEFLSPYGDIVGGCWVRNRKTITVVFFDGDSIDFSSEDTTRPAES